MKYFTIAEPRNTQAAYKDLGAFTVRADKDEGHKLVWALFQDDPNAPRDFLYRKSPDNNRLVIVSSRPPVVDDAVWDIKTKPYDPALVAGQRFGFILRVNPTISKASDKRDDNGKRERGKRIDVLLNHKQENPDTPFPPEEQEKIALAWLDKKLTSHGATLEQPVTSMIEYRQLRPKQGATISVLDVEGVLTVTDPVALTKAMFDGIGHGKAYGLGLLLLRPLAT